MAKGKSSIMLIGYAFSNYSLNSIVYNLRPHPFFSTFLFFFFLSLVLGSHLIIQKQNDQYKE